jgi:hypothetical protein
MYLEYSRSQQSVYEGSLPSHSDSFSSNLPCSTFALLLSLAWLLTAAENAQVEDQSRSAVGKRSRCELGRAHNLIRRRSCIVVVVLATRAGAHEVVCHGTNPAFH